MKNLSAAAAVALILAALATTGFQCGSAEMTSAKLYMQRSEWDKAEASLARETEKNPANAEAWYLLGEVRRNVKNYAGMMDAYNNSLKAGNQFEADINRYRRGVWGSLLNEGVGSFNRARETKAQDSVALLRQTAIDRYKSAILVNPDSGITYYYLGLGYMAEGKTTEEIAALEEGLKHGPTADLRRTLISAYVTQGQDAEAKGDKAGADASYAKALTALQEARAQDPGNTELLGTMIDLYTRTNRAAEAKPYMYQALASDPGNKSYNYNLGVLLMQDPAATPDTLSAAIAHFEKAVQADPKFDVAIQNAAIAYMKRGDMVRKAEQEAAEKKKGATADPKKWTDDFKKAADYFKQLTELKPTDEKIWDALATAYANANMLAQAKEAMKKADELRKK